MKKPVHYDDETCAEWITVVCGLSIWAGNGDLMSTDPTKTTCGNCKRTEAHKKAMEARHD